MCRTLVCLGYLSMVAGKVYFSETFDDDWESRWVKSEWRKAEGLHGDFVLSAGSYFIDENESKGLLTTEDSKFYDVSASFEKFSNENKTIIIQFQIKYEKLIECGGGYIKVGPTMADGGKMFGHPTKYNIMFGPDACGYTKRTQLVFHHKGVNVLKKHDMVYKQKIPKVSHLYRMILNPNNTAKVEIDEEEAYYGNIKEDWELLDAKEIPNPASIKPEDWIEESFIDDPLDPKPADWVDEENARIRNPKSVKPEEWDDEEDGEWLAPIITHPDFKGTWKAHSRVKNPVFKGYWEQEMIPNPEFHDEPDPYKYDDFGYVGIDLWQIEAGTLFDNIIITDNVAEADVFAAKWRAVKQHEWDEMMKQHDIDQAKYREENKHPDLKYNPDDEEEDYDEEEEKRGEDL